MNFLELYSRLYIQTSIMQFIIMVVMLVINYDINSGFSLAANLVCLLYFFTSIFSYYLTKKDVEIDQIAPNDRTDSQKRLQFVKIAIDLFLMLLSLLTVLLTSIALVLQYVSASI